MQKPRTIMIYGESGSTKTSQVYHLAKWINKTTGLKGRFIGYNASDIVPFEESGMIERGEIDYYDVSNPKFALQQLRLLSDGLWPVDLQESKSVIIPKGHLQRDEHCKTDWEKEKIGFYIIEGLYGCSRTLLGHIANQQEKVGFTGSYKIEEEGEFFGGLDQGHYGMVQQELYRIIVQRFATLPIQYLIVTSLVGKGKDKKKEAIYGPKSAGDAQTYEIPSWFHDCWHLADQQMENAEGKIIEKKVAWFEKHPDVDTDIPCLAKVRIMPELYPTFKKETGGTGFVELGFQKGLEKAYETIGSIVERKRKMDEKEKGTK